MHVFLNKFHSNPFLATQKKFNLSLILLLTTIDVIKHVCIDIIKLLPENKEKKQQITIIIIDDKNNNKMIYKNIQTVFILIYYRENKKFII